LPQAELTEEVAAMFRRLTLAECEERFGKADCCFAPVLDLREALESPHVRARGLVRRTAAGEVQALFPVVIDGERPMPRASIRAFETNPGRLT
jgi:crotonobetainyl-CoA:carnitine CoA-transferase CaiB-like acyl-CoA transferase